MLVFPIRRCVLRAAFAALLAALPLTGPALAEPLDEATAAFKRGDYATAMSLLQALADEGNSSAQYNLGMMYIQGKGVPQDLAKGAQWYRKAAEHGDPDAQHALGDMYRGGIGVRQSNAEAAKWYRLAAEHGDGIAQFTMGVMYGQGEGVPINFVEAYRWFTLAASHLPAEDTYNREKALKNRNLLIGGMSPAQIAEAQKLAREFKPTE